MIRTRPARSRPSCRARSVAGLLAGLLVVGQACYHYRAVPVEPATEEEVGGAPALATDYEGETVWALGWGLLQERPFIDNCQGQPLAEVQVTTNLGFTLLTIVTLGFASPARVQWRCAKPTPTDTPIGGSETEAEPAGAEGVGALARPRPNPFGVFP